MDQDRPRDDEYGDGREMFLLSLFCHVGLWFSAGVMVALGIVEFFFR